MSCGFPIQKMKNLKESIKCGLRTLYVHLSNGSEEALINDLKEHIYTIRSWFVDKDQQRRLQKLKISADKEMEKQIQRSYGLNLTIPNGYKIVSSEDNFIWLRKDNPKTNIISNIWLHSQAYLSPEQFNKKSLIALRDSIGKAHVKALVRIIYGYRNTLYSRLQTNKRNLTLLQQRVVDHEKRLLGGPYTAYAILDEEKQKIIYVEGFIYCPGERKRAMFLN